MFLMEIDGNYIDAEPLKNKTDGVMIKAYLLLWERLTAKGTVKATTHIMDNDASAEYKMTICKNCIIQLVPQNNHQQNLAERVIQTFKRHFKAVLAGVDNNFPMRLWDKLLPQAILTLNLLCQSNAVPTVSANQYINGPFDYNKMPLRPMGCAVLMHRNRSRQGTLAEHSINGWYLQTSPEHYRCHVIYVKNTKSRRISDSAFFKHKHITQPTLSLMDRVIKAIGDLKNAIKRKRDVEGIKKIKAIKQLDDF
jgi:hypothetical protein